MEHDFLSFDQWGKSELMVEVEHLRRIIEILADTCKDSHRGASLAALQTVENSRKRFPVED